MVGLLMVAFIIDIRAMIEYHYHDYEHHIISTVIKLFALHNMMTMTYAFTILSKYQITESAFTTLILN